MEDLIKEYTEGLKRIRKAQQESTDVEDKRILSSMASDLQYALDWLKSGRCPENRRGVERLAAYQRERAVDPFILQSMVDQFSRRRECTVTEWDRLRIREALSVLTKREREVFLMSRAENFSYEQIAVQLGISKSSVQTMISRAEQKIVIRKKDKLFYSTNFCHTNAT